ncbi:hypothetical protein EVU96_08830 [Bacillus infantis]|nr:hypothetical protein EVU96_08830 [Bacillus infantis]
MAKTELTTQLERQIYGATNKQGIFGCFEVTIGWFGEERVDYITYDTKGIWRCYEVKVSKSDFYSKAKKTFVGHFNYFVMPKELYEEVKDDIPNHVGVYLGNYCKKRAKKQELLVDEQVLKDSMIRSLAREVTKMYKSEDPNVIDYLNRRISRAEQEAKQARSNFYELNRRVVEKYGRRWDE